MPAISKAEAMQINAEPWEPLPGMVKVQCEECWFFFAAPHHTATLCPDCVIKLELIARRAGH